MNRKLLFLAKSAAQVATKAGATDARVFVSRSRGVKVEWRDGKLDRIRESTSLGLTLELYVDGRYSTNATSDLREDQLRQYVENAVSTTRYLAPDPHRTLPAPARYENATTRDLEIGDPSIERVTPSQRLEVAEALEAAARKEDSRSSHRLC